MRRPIAYFFPGDIGGDYADDEAELLNLFRSLPDSLKKENLDHLRIEALVYEELQPYVRAGIPEEFYDRLRIDIGGRLYEPEPPKPEPKLTAEEALDREKRYRKWREETDASLGRQE